MKQAWTNLKRQRLAIGDAFPQPTAVCSYLFTGFKVFLANAAERANPIIGQIIESCSWRNAVFRIPKHGVVNITAYGANIFFHLLILFVWLILFFVTYAIKTSGKAFLFVL